MHGGGFAVGSAASHHKLAGHVAKALGATAVVLDYRRAPEHPHPAQVEDGVAVFTALLDRGIRPEDVTPIGDSAGGNLAVAIPLALREQGGPLPGSVIAFSPWLDMENKGETLRTNDATDALITVELLEGMIAGVLGEAVHPATPLANPLYADFTGFPRLYVNAGGAESLLDNATRLAERTRAAGVDVTLSVVDGMQHVFPFLAGRAREADEEIAAIGRWYRSRPRSCPQLIEGSAAVAADPSAVVDSEQGGGKRTGWSGELPAHAAAALAAGRRGAGPRPDPAGARRPARAGGAGPARADACGPRGDRAQLAPVRERGGPHRARVDPLQQRGGPRSPAPRGRGAGPRTAGRAPCRRPGGDVPEQRARRDRPAPGPRTGAAHGAGPGVGGRGLRLLRALHRHQRARDGDPGAPRGAGAGQRALQRPARGGHLRGHADLRAVHPADPGQLLAGLRGRGRQPADVRDHHRRPPAGRDEPDRHARCPRAGPDPRLPGRRPGRRRAGDRGERAHRLRQHP